MTLQLFGMTPTYSFLAKIYLSYIIFGWSLLITTNARLLVPRRRSIQDRIQFALFSSPTLTTLKLRILLRIVIHLSVILPLAAWLWSIDEVFFSSYKSTVIQEPVILISVPRAGTTSLHSTVAKDTNTFVTPTTSEFVLPFLSIQYILQYLHCSFPNTIQRVEHVLKLLNGVTKEVEQRHPVSLFYPDADDVLIGEWQWSAVGSVRTFPSLKHWYAHYDFASFTKKERKHILDFHALVCKKVLYHRGDLNEKRRGNAASAKRLLIRSHLSACFDDFQIMYPDASFIGIMRDPIEVLESFAGLSDIVVYNATGYKMLDHQSTATKSQYITNINGSQHDHRFETLSWSNAFVAILSDMMGREARLHCILRKGRNQSKPSTNTMTTSMTSPSISLKSGIISFQQFKSNPFDAIKILYQSIGIIDMDVDYVKTFLDKEVQTHHFAYKKKHDYLNPSIKELGIDEDSFLERKGVRDYHELMKTTLEN